MQPKLIFNCFKLCLIIGICTAAPADSDTSSDSEAADRGKIVKLQGDENTKNTGADATLSDDEGAHEGTINAEAKEDASVADQVQTGENRHNAVQDNEEPVETDGADNPAADDQKDAEIHENEVQDNSLNATDDPVNADEQNVHVTDEPIDEENKDNEVHDDGLTADPIHSDEKDSPATDEPIQKENKDNEVQDNASDVNDIQDDKNNDFDNTSVMPTGFKLTAAEMAKFKIWPTAKIPYYIDELSYDKVLRDKIRHYLDEARSLTGLQFEELPEPLEFDADRWVFFVNRRGQLDCKDYNTNSFTNGGVQKVIVGYNCLQHGGPMAAIVLALLGVPPEHNAPNRDKYINVVTDHILPDKKGLFKRLKDGDWLFHDLPYDINSVSHYPSHKYTADGSETIKLLAPGGLKQRRQRSRKATATGPSGYFTQWGHSFGAVQDISLDTEKRTYSPTDLLKIFYLYSNIMLNKPQGIKAEDCKSLYRASPYYTRNVKLAEPKKHPARPKPAKYLAAVKNNNGRDRLLSHPIDMKGELLSELDDE